jgi:uncharacterized protein GlcG (DUF336 family)
MTAAAHTRPKEEIPMRVSRLPALAGPVLTGVVLLGLAGAAGAQELVTQKALSADQAHRVVQGTIEKCRADGYKVSVAVLDRGGNLQAFVRDDGTGPHTISTARRKAYTALTFKQTSAEFANRLASNPASAGLKDVTDVILLGGGVPIKVGNDVIGAVGVSGAPGGDKDEACANAGIQKIAEHLK